MKNKLRMDEPEAPKKKSVERIDGFRPREPGEGPRAKNYQHEKTGFSGMTARYGTGKHIDESFHEGHLKTIQDIAKKHLDLDTLETRRSDDHDFSTQGVWGIHDALKAAFQAGRKAK